MAKKIVHKPSILLVWPNYADKDSFCHSSEGPEILTRACEKVGLTKAKFDIQQTVLVPKIFPRGKKPPRAVLSEFSPNLHLRIEKLDPAIILAMGAVAFEALTGMKRIMEWVGRELKTEKGLFTEKQWIVIPTLHPDHVAMIPMRNRDLQTSLERAVRSIAGTARKVAHKELRRKKVKYTHYTHEESTELEQRLLSLDGVISFDYETSSLDPWREEKPFICVVGFCTKMGEAFTAELGRDTTKPNFRVVKEWLLRDGVRRKAFNGKFEIKWSRAIFKVHPKVEEDPMLKHHLMEEESSHRLEILALNHTTLGEYDREVKTLKNKGVPHHKMSMNVLSQYCAGDCDATVRVDEYLERTWKKDVDYPRIRNLYYKEVIPTMHVLAAMEEDGIQVDRMAHKREYRKVKDRYIELIDKLHTMLPIKRTIKALGLGPNEMFNVASAEQVSTLLYQALDLPVKDLTKTGAASTADDALDRHKNRHACVPIVRELRTLKAELRDLEEIKKFLRRDGRINTNFRQDKVVSGRLSSSEPNLQNMGVKSVAKKLFVSRFVENGERGEIQSYDYKQQEVIVLASLSNETLLIDAFKSGRDVHTVTASTIFEVPYEKVDYDSQRYPAKRATFGIVFGIGPKKLANEIHWEVSATEKLLATYFHKHAKMKVWIDVEKAKARHSKRAITEFGRVRRLPNICHSNNLIKWAAERAAVNHRVQGTAAGVTMLAILLANVLLKKRNLRSKLILTVHDSLVFDVHPHEKQAVRDVAREAMIEYPSRHYSWLKVPFQVDLMVGPNYLDLEKSTL